MTWRKKNICQPPCDNPFKAGGQVGGGNEDHEDIRREEESLPEAEFTLKVGYIAVVSSRRGKPEVLVRPEPRFGGGDG